MREHDGLQEVAVLGVERLAVLADEAADRDLQEAVGPDVVGQLLQGLGLVDDA